MNRLQGTLVETRGDGLVRLAVIDVAAGRLFALVLDVGSPDRRLVAGREVRAIFKETALVVAAFHHPALVGRLDALKRGGVVVEFGAILLGGSRVEGFLPAEEFPPELEIGDEIHLHVPASAVALEFP
jgi:hypothetical protein